MSDVQSPESPRAALPPTSRGRLLRDAPPAYCRGLALGTSMILWGTIAEAVLSAAGLLLLLSVVRSPVEVDAPDPAGLLYGLTAAVLVSTLGAWIVTMPKPAGRPGDPLGRARWGVRILLVARLLAAASPLAERVVTDGYALRLTAGPWLCFALGGTVMRFAGVVGSVLLILHFRRLALQVPAPGLARSTRAVAWLLGMGLAAETLVSATWDPTAGSSPEGIASLLACPGAVFLLVGGILWLVLLVRYARRFREQATATPQTPAGPEGTDEAPA